MKIATRIQSLVERSGMIEFRVLDSLGLTSANALRVILSRLSRSGAVLNSAKGIYVAPGSDPFRIATLIRPGYVSLSAALYLHKLIDEYPFTIHVMADAAGSFALGEHEIVYIKAKDYHGLVEAPYRMAGVEKALCDCLRHPELVGFGSIARALFNCSISSREFMRVSHSEKSAFFQRLGYILSLLPELDCEKKMILEQCRKRIRGKIYLFGRGKGTYVREWKLVDNVGKEAMLSWWNQ